MPTLKGTEVSLSYVQCFLYLISPTINISIFHITRLDTSWTGLVYSSVDGLRIFHALATANNAEIYIRK